MTIILDGKTLSEQILNNLKGEIAKNNYFPSIAVIIVGNKSASWRNAWIVW